MKAVEIRYLQDLTTLAERVRSLMGFDTELYVEITKHPVRSDGTLIGHFVWMAELEDIVFKPTEV